MKKLLLASLICFAIAIGTASLIFAAFDPHTSPTLTPHIGTVRIELVRTVSPSELPEGQTQAINYVVMVDDQYHNSMDTRSGDLAPHLTTAQKDQLIAFMDMLWTKAENEILP